MKKAYKLLKKSFILIAGSLIIICGVLLLVLPGPGLLTIAVGLILLSTEFSWAHKYLHKVRTKMNEAYEKAKDIKKRKK